MSDAHIQLVDAIGQWRKNLTPMPDELRVTQQQWEEIWNAMMPPEEPPPIGQRVGLFGIPGVIVERDEDSTLYQEERIRAAEAHWRKA